MPYPLLKIGWQFIKMLSINLPYSIASSFLGFYPNENTFLINNCSVNVIVALFIIAKNGINQFSLIRK
jgi:hypothetical protein